jgi:hypothetical protein
MLALSLTHTGSARLLLLRLARHRDEPHRNHGLFAEAIFGPRDAQEALEVLAHWNDQPAPDGELLLERLWNLRRSRGDEDGIER